MIRSYKRQIYHQRKRMESKAHGSAKLTPISSRARDEPASTKAAWSSDYHISLMNPLEYSQASAPTYRRKSAVVGLGSSSDNRRPQIAETPGSDVLAYDPCTEDYLIGSEVFAMQLLYTFASDIDFFRVHFVVFKCCGVSCGGLDYYPYFESY